MGPPARWRLSRCFLACLAINAPNEVPAQTIAKAAGYDGGAKSLTAITGIVSLKSREVEREWAFTWCGRRDGDTWYSMNAKAGEAFVEALDEACPGLREDLAE